MQAAAEQVIHPGKLTWLIVGDRAQVEASVRELGLGPVRVLNTDGELVEP